MEFREDAELLIFRDKVTKTTLIAAINTSIHHNFRQSIPKNVIPELIKNDFYFVNSYKNNVDKDIFLQTMNLETARYYSEIIDDTTVLQISTSGKGKSKSESETL